ncbi:MAG TPA: efflux RND transporter periplasmic adaptor subunit [Ramlibacter sp.]|nr:efflux RND transporter periplasmic adaptor subunit [Ramlibacter sp.]
MTAAAPSAAALGVLRAQAALFAFDRLAQSACAFASEVAQVVGCGECAVGLLADGTIAIAGTSAAAELDPRSAAAAALTAAMHEACDQARGIAWPVAREADHAIAQAQRQLAGRGAAASVPLVDGTRIVGALTVVRHDPIPFGPDDLLLLEEIAGFCGPVLEMRRKLHRTWRERVRDALREGVARLGAGRRGWIVAGVTVCVLAAPLPWRVSAPARLEGAVQRAVVAASDGYLQQVNVRPGDRVKAGQVLAELASQDLELERQRRESELRQHETAFRAAQARYDRPQMVAAQAKAAEAEAMLSLAQAQLERARAVAPFDGVVIKGDLSQTLGAPVQRGETLMVIAPDNDFRLILEVDEADIAAIQVGQRGEVALASRPGEPLGFEVRRIVPVSSSSEGRNFFEVEGRLQDPSGALRPGLAGIAKVHIGWRPLAMLLAHRPAAWLRMAWWGLVP